MATISSHRLVRQPIPTPQEEELASIASAPAESANLAPESRSKQPPGTEELSLVDFDWRQVLLERTEPPKLPRESVERFLQQNRRNPAGLLAAYHSLGDTNYLREAADHFPNNSRVQLAVLNLDIFSGERREWLDLFKVSSPDNALANYLSAREQFRTGQTEADLQELLEAAGKRQLADYTLESKLDEEELNLCSGRSTWN